LEGQNQHFYKNKHWEKRWVIANVLMSMEKKGLRRINFALGAFLFSFIARCFIHSVREA
jgi:hypothetical protein